MSNRSQHRYSGILLFKSLGLTHLLPAIKKAA